MTLMSMRVRVRHICGHETEYEADTKPFPAPVATVPSMCAACEENQELLECFGCGKRHTKQDSRMPSQAAAAIGLQCLRKLEAGRQTGEGRS